MYAKFDKEETIHMAERVPAGFEALLQASLLIGCKEYRLRIVIDRARMDAVKGYGDPSAVAHVSRAREA
jgi:hypothetical protein